MVGIWDARDNKKVPQILSEVENSHYEPVMDLIWLSSKSGSEFVTCSTDGQVLWWDCRDLSQPTDKLLIQETQPVKGVYDKVIGVTSFEYVPDYGPKYLMGTEKGSILLATKKPKKKVEIN